ncbi:hypothetical protein RDABS01_032275 [Bienertia sinuspersici]
MAEEYCGGVNWWDSSTTNRSRFDGSGGGGGGSSSSSSTTTLANSGGGPGYGWLAEGSTAVDTKWTLHHFSLWGLACLPSHGRVEPATTNSCYTVHATRRHGSKHNFQHDTTGGGGGGGGGGVIFGDHNSSQLHQWRPEKLFPNNEDSNSEFKQINRGFSLDNQHQFSPSTGSSIESTVTCQGLTTPSNFNLDCSSTNSVFGSPSSILQGLLGTEQHNNMHNHNKQQQQQQFSSANNYQQNYFGLGVSNDPHNHHHQQQQQPQQHESQLPSSWAKVPQFLRASSPKQQQQQLQFINNTPYWSGSTPLNEVRPNFFSSLQAAQLPNMPAFEEKPKTTMEVRDTSSMVKKSGPENNSKRGRNMVRKEKMGDRITALQQLVSPFGKTDTASVLSEAIEYIKFLHEQVSVLSNPYLKSGGSYQQNQPSEKAKIDPDGPKQDLRSRGLCLVPVSSTFPVTHETTVDFWTPTFGGTFR